MITIKAMRLDDGDDVVTRWYQQESLKAQARLDARMIHLRQQPRDNWTRPLYDTLRDGVGEVRFKVARIQHRALGYFGPGRNEFTFLFFATKTDRWDPYNSIEFAIERKEIVEAEPGRAVRLKKWGQQ